MSGTRIKGQETEIVFIENNVPLTTLADVKSFEVEIQLEILKEGYLGETTDRRDSVYRGFSGKMEAHFETRDVLSFATRLVDKARRRVPGARVNCKTTLNLPDGDRVRVVLKDLEFGPIPLNVAGRTDYVSVSLSFEGANFTVI